jgi:hypothetical protein
VLETGYTLLLVGCVLVIACFFGYVAYRLHVEHR